MSFSLLANCRTNQIKIVQESLMLIIILSLFKTKEFVKEILYELFSPKGAYSTVEGTKYCRNCANNRLQFAGRTMVFVETCQNLPKLAAHIVTGFDRTIRSVSTLSSASHLFTGADSLVCPDTLKSLLYMQFVIHPLPFIPHVAEVQMCRCDVLSRVLRHSVILCEYFCT